MYSDIFSFFPLNTKTHSYCWIDCSFTNNHAHSSRNFYIHSGNLRVYHVKIVKPKPENGDGWNMLLVRVSSFVSQSRRELRGFISDMEY